MMRMQKSHHIIVSAWLHFADVFRKSLPVSFGEPFEQQHSQALKPLAKAVLGWVIG